VTPAQTELLAAAREAVIEADEGSMKFDALVRERLRAAIQAVDREEAQAKPEPRGAQIVDLEAALKASLGQRKA
jgi:non-homologous end joining protein Ku